jgi:hypothetical protein
MVAWASAILGQLVDADQMTAAGMRLLYPHNVQDPALHLLAWRTYAFTLLGRWDEAAETGQRMLQLWAEGGRYAAGHSLFGFVAALDVAGGRQDESMVERLRDAAIQIVDMYPAGHAREAIWRAHLLADFNTLEHQLLGDSARPFESYQYPAFVERFCSSFADAHRALKPEVTGDILKAAVSHHCLVLEAQVRRVIGLTSQDPEELRRSLEIFDRIGARPYAARARCELALLSRDKRDFESGLAVLAAVGDRQQRERYETSWAGGRRAGL